MKRFYSIVGALVIGATSLFAQTNYTVTFKANVTMDKIQVKNLQSGVTKTLNKPDNVITLQKNAKQSGTPIESVDQFEFLQQTASNEVVVNMEKAGRLNLTLYSSNGTFVTRYANNVDVGPNAFQIGASSGMYVLVASANNQTASLKILLTQSTEPSILEVLTSKPEPMLKSVNDVITFDEGDEFEFTGYYYSQTKVETLHSAFITSDKQIRFSFTKVSAPTVTTVEATNVTSSSATVGGNVTNDNGTSVTERGVCWATTDNPTVSGNKIVSGKGTGSFSVTLSSLSAGTTYYVRAYAKNNEGTSYGTTITFTPNIIVNGAIQKAFSVSATKKVYFSQGNLQYQASTETWRFAEHQYNMTGNANTQISSSYSGWIDIFCWGTSGWNSGATEYQPYSTGIGIPSSAYAPGGNADNDLTGSYANADWGVYNKISNGGNATGMWRTLTQDEWKYLLFRRTEYANKKGVACVNGVNGLIILPDEWTLPDGIVFTSGYAIEEGSKYFATINSFTASEWAKMEANGAVFLPAAGYRDLGGSLGDPKLIMVRVGRVGDYWTSSADRNSGNDLAVRMCFHSANDGSVTASGGSRDNGRSVRLVQDVK